MQWSLATATAAAVLVALCADGQRRAGVWRCRPACKVCVLRPAIGKLTQRTARTAARWHSLDIRRPWTVELTGRWAYLVEEHPMGATETEDARPDCHRDPQRVHGRVVPHVTGSAHREIGGLR